MLFRVSGRGPQRRRRRMAVACLGDADDAAPRPRRGGRGGRMFALGKLRLWALLLRSRRVLARLRSYYADMMKRLIADAAAAEPAKARRAVVEAAGTGPETMTTVLHAGRPAAVVVPSVVAGTVLRCSSHYYIR